MNTRPKTKDWFAAVKEDGVELEYESDALKGQVKAAE